MPWLPFANCCSVSTVKIFVRFASQIFFCYREKVINFLAIELHLCNQHYDLVFLKVTGFCTCLLVNSAPFLGTKNQNVCRRSVVVVVWSCSLSSHRVLFCSVVSFGVAELYILTSAADDSVENVVLSCVLNKTLILKLWTRPYLQVGLKWLWWCLLLKNVLTALRKMLLLLLK